MTQDSYFERIGEGRFRATHHTSGAWRQTEQHFAPGAGLLVNEIDRHLTRRGEDDLVTARVAFDILGTVAIDELEIRVDVIRPGRTIELIEAVGSAGGRSFAVARAWRLLRVDTADVVGGEPTRLPSPDTLETWAMHLLWPGDFIASVEVRPVREPEPGRATAWVRTPLELIAGEAPSPLARFVSLIDVANGIAVRYPPDELFYPNVDLTIHLYRQPTGEWVGLDTTVVFGPTGQGLTSTALHDVDGPVGVAIQTLTIRPHPGR